LERNGICAAEAPCSAKKATDRDANPILR
jgi:hypothetical protein